MVTSRTFARGVQVGVLAALLPIACGRSPSTPALSITTTPDEPGAQSQPGTQTEPPHVVAFDPPLGATNVDPARTTLAVTFDRVMDRDGWAWVIESKSTAPDIGESSWDVEARTNSAPVRLEPGRTYVVWINSPQYSYFKDPQGRAATPVRWSFTTRAAAAPPVR